MNPIFLPKDEIHIWQISLNQPLENRAWVDEVLSVEERQRGERFLREEHRRRFCLARAFLRVILGNYTGTQPAGLQFWEGPHGKPYLQDNPDSLQFNLSHSQDRAIIAVNWRQEIGVDIEQVNPAIAIHPLTARFFTPQERQEIFALPQDQQLPAFYRIWTRKEAVIKATGKGISGLSESAGSQSCAIVDLETVPGYTAALAAVSVPGPFSKQIRYQKIKDLDGPLTSVKD